MKKVAILAVAGLAAGANAQSAGLDIQVSLDGGATWSNIVDAGAGDVVTVGVFGTFSGAYGFAGATFNVLSDDRGAGDAAALGGRAAPFTFGAATQAVYDTANGFRIDAANDAANSSVAGIAVLQNTPVASGTSFSTDNPALLYTFTYTVGDASVERTIDLVIGDISRNAIGVYSSANATRSTQLTNISRDAGAIRVIPAPGALALVGLGALAAGRRRR